jgi:hypothetical protein
MNVLKFLIFGVIMQGIKKNLNVHDLLLCGQDLYGEIASDYRMFLQSLRKTIIKKSSNRFLFGNALPCISQSRILNPIGDK